MAGKIDIPSKILEDYLKQRKGGKKALADIRTLSTQKNIPLINAFKELYKGHQQYEHILKQIQSKIDTMQKDDTGEAKTLIDEKAKSIYHDPTIIPTTKQSKLEQKAKDNTATINSQEKELTNSSGLDIGAEFTEEDLKPDPLASMLANENSQTKKIKPSQQRYIPKRKLGEGGMGLVLLAQDTILEREVALKQFKTQDISKLRQENLKRFQLEAKITGQLDHPNIPPVHDLGTEPVPQFVMDVIKGEDLSKVIKELNNNNKKYKQKYDTNQMLRIFLKACEGIAYAHSKKIIHRDIKPENIMTGKFGEVLVMDWGLGKKQGTPDITGKSIIPNQKNSNLTMEGTIMGTPMYMSPEQANAELDEIDEQSDIYSLGATLHEILTGQKPIPGTTIQNILHNVLLGKKNKMKKLIGTNEKVPKELQSITNKAMQTEKTKRYKKTQELIEDIQAYLDGEKVSAHNDTFMDNAKRFVKKHSNKLIAGGIVAVLAAAGVAGWVYQSGQATRAQLGQAKAEAKASKEKEKRAKAEKEKVEEREKATKDKLEAIIKTEKRRDTALDILQYGIEFYRDGKDYPNAIKEFNRALKIDPDNPNVLCNRAYVYYLDDKLELAEKDIKKALKIIPNDSLFHMTHGKILEKQKKYDKAEKTFIKATKVKEHPLPKSIFELGCFYRRTAVKRYKNSIPDRIAQYKKGVESFTKYLRVMENDGEGYYTRGGAYLGIGICIEEEQNKKTSQEKSQIASIWYKKAEQDGKITIEKGCNKGYGILGSVIYQIGRFDGTFVNAEENLRKAIYCEQGEELENIKWMLEQIEKRKKQK